MFNLTNYEHDNISIVATYDVIQLDDIFPLPFNVYGSMFFKLRTVNKGVEKIVLLDFNTIILKAGNQSWEMKTQ